MRMHRLFVGAKRPNRQNHGHLRSTRIFLRIGHGVVGCSFVRYDLLARINSPLRVSIVSLNILWKIDFTHRTTAAQNINSSSRLDSGLRYVWR